MLSLLSTTQVGLMGKLWFSSGVMWAVCWQSMGSFGLPFYLQRVSVVRLGTEPKNMWYNLSTSYSFFCCCWSISQLRQKFLHLKSWSETKWKNSVHCSHCLYFLFLFFFLGKSQPFTNAWRAPCSCDFGIFWWRTLVAADQLPQKALLRKIPPWTDTTKVP